jgi:hypothetical protein
MPVASDVFPPHLESLVASEWGVWRWFVLRGAGFPEDFVRRLAQPNCALLADTLISAEDRVTAQFQYAIRILNETLDQLSRQGEDRYGPLFKAVLNGRRRLAEGKIPHPGDFSPEICQMFNNVAEAIQEQGRLHAEWNKTFPDFLLRQSTALREFARDPKFQTAVIWQNRQAFETAVQSVAHQNSQSTRNQRQRSHEELVASYAQRYCVKNDTIGFFGPVAWGSIEPGDDMVDLSHGASLIKKRRTYFESWAVDKLAASLSLLEGMDWWIPPRLVPDVFIKNGTLHRTGASAIAITELEQAVLALIDGKRLPGDILRAIQNDRPIACGQQEIRDLLAGKAAEGIIVWRFLVPVEVNSEIGLRQQLLKIDNLSLRAVAISRLDMLETARNEVAKAADDPILLNEALRKLERLFEEMANVRGHRNPGTTYGARGILYEDCQRDLAFRITPDLLVPIVPALSLLLQSLRWLMQTTAFEFHRLFRQTYGEIAASGAGPDVPLLDWWIYTEPKLLNAPSLADVQKEFSRKWAEILPVKGESCAEFQSSNLKEQIEQMFPELGSGYHPVRYFCPDLMLAAKDPEAIRRGELLYILGEVHSGKNTLSHAALVEQHPNRKELVDAVEWDLASGSFKIVTPQEAETTAVRTSDGLLRPADYLLATTPDSVAPTGYVSRRIGELLIREQGEELRVISRLDGRSFHILEAFSDLLFGFVMNKASWLPQLPHTPRVVIDKLVIHRETWRFRKDDLAFGMEKDESMRFLGARRWMKKFGLPCKTFVKSASEMKPFYLDLDSPILVEILCRAIRRMGSSGKHDEELTFSEMLPGTDQLWLRDESGASYTSELRFAVVDLKARP